MIEYRVRPVTRYIVTRYHKGEQAVGVGQRGEYDNAHVAYEVAYALCKAEHDQLGWPPGDERIQYPLPIDTSFYVRAGVDVPVTFVDDVAAVSGTLPDNVESK